MYQTEYFLLFFIRVHSEFKILGPKKDNMGNYCGVKLKNPVSNNSREGG
jgi:hypothetical protein